MMCQEIYKDCWLQRSAFDLRMKRDVQSNPRSCIQICQQIYLYTRRWFIGIQRLLRAGILLRTLLNGVVNVRPSKQQQDGRITYNICNASRNTILKWLVPRKPGNYFKRLICPTWFEKLWFTPAGGVTTTSKKFSSLFPGCKRDSFPLILNPCLRYSPTTPFVFTGESRSSLWVTHLLGNEMNHKQEGLPFPSVSREGYQGSVVRLIDANLADVYIWSKIPHLFHPRHHCGVTNLHEKKETRSLLSSSMLLLCLLLRVLDRGLMLYVWA